MAEICSARPFTCLWRCRREPRSERRCSRRTGKRMRPVGGAIGGEVCLPGQEEVQRPERWCLVPMCELR
ncbi:hypothetical protein NDU88_003207 [Pleurodeles waltl]|uniref:Uncharacterized protein n=1 Tax=Pleurodeles waltl TaxID=8319 RepID=A0AAV7KWF1_PLEWA|nr:hypothetical protein NDU88_003207 [Pleurodeles waltl]